jgi:hypothetical protein
LLIYLDNALSERRARSANEGRPSTHEDLRAAIMANAVERVRPKMMTVTAIIAGLLPILWSHGTGSELMQRIAVPMIGGLLDHAHPDRDPGDLRDSQGLAAAACSRKSRQRTAGGTAGRVRRRSHALPTRRACCNR